MKYATCNYCGDFVKVRDGYVYCSYCRSHDFIYDTSKEEEDNTKENEDDNDSIDE